MTDEHPRPGDDEPSTQVGTPRPSGEMPTYPHAVPDPPPQQPQPQPQPAPQQAPPPQPQQPYYPPQQAYPPQPSYQQPQPYQYPAPVMPPPHETVQGGDGTLWLRPDSGVRPAPGPAPPATYLGAPVANPYPAYPPYSPVPVEPSNGKAVAALVLGITGLIFLLSGLGILFFINLPCSILAWVFGVQGKRIVDRGETTRGDGMAKTGIWTGAIGTVLGALAIVIWIVAIAASA